MLFKTSFSPKCSPGHTDCVFNKLSKTFPSEVACFLPIKTETEKFFPKKLIEMFLLSRKKCSFDNPAETLLPEFRIVLAQSTQDGEKLCS